MCPVGASEQIIIAALDLKHRRGKSLFCGDHNFKFNTILFHSYTIKMIYKMETL